MHQPMTVVLVQNNMSSPPKDFQCCLCIPNSMGIWLMGAWQLLNFYFLYKSAELAFDISFTLPAIGITLLVIILASAIISFIFWFFTIKGIEAGTNTSTGRGMIRSGVKMLQLC